MEGSPWNLRRRYVELGNGGLGWGWGEEVAVEKGTSVGSWILKVVWGCNRWW